jgi:hypothetical protein
LRKLQFWQKKMLPKMKKRYFGAFVPLLLAGSVVAHALALL